MVCLFRAASKQLNCRQSRRQVGCHNSFGVYFLSPFFQDFQLVKFDHGRPNGSCGYERSLYVSFYFLPHALKICLFLYTFLISAHLFQNFQSVKFDHAGQMGHVDTFMAGYFYLYLFRCVNICVYLYTFSCRLDGKQLVDGENCRE